jgi:hypothetical protein
MTWQTPKIDWAVSSAPGPGDFNRIEGNIQDLSLRFLNLSFEYGSDGLLDAWTFEPFPNGFGSIDTQNSVHGAKCFSITHPGGAGNGGGILTSDFIPAGLFNSNFLGFYLWSTAATIKNQVIISFYDKNKQSMSEVTLYDSVNNPVAPVMYITQIPASPSGAGFYKIKVIGGDPSVSVAGTTYIDGFTLNPIELRLSKPDFAISEKTRANTAYGDVATVAVAFHPNINLVNISNILFRFNVELKTSNYDYAAYVRFRVGSTYSAELSTTSTAYVQGLIGIQGLTEMPFTIAMQLRSLNATAIAASRKQADPYRFYTDLWVSKT